MCCLVIVFDGLRKTCTMVTTLFSYFFLIRKKRRFTSCAASKLRTSSAQALLYPMGALLYITYIIQCLRNKNICSQLYNCTHNDRSWWSWAWSRLECVTLYLISVNQSKTHAWLHDVKAPSRKENCFITLFEPLSEGLKLHARTSPSFPFIFHLSVRETRAVQAVNWSSICVVSPLMICDHRPTRDYSGWLWYQKVFLTLKCVT